MSSSSSSRDQAVADIARKHGFGTDAAAAMLSSVQNGHGTMAQFNHPELGGAGQWMRGGMTMISDMFNHNLKSRVSALADDLSDWLASNPQSSSSGSSAQRGGDSSGSFGGNSGGGGHGNWWPEEFSNPNSSGSQNGQRYAYFGNAHRLVVDQDGQVSVYDTQDHQIGGVSQQQSRSGSMTFTSQRGTVDVSQLPLISRRTSTR